MGRHEAELGGEGLQAAKKGPGVRGPRCVGAQVCGDPGVQGPRCAGSLHLLTSVLPPPLRGAFAMTVMIKDQEETPWQIYSAPKLGWATELN